MLPGPFRYADELSGLISAKLALAVSAEAETDILKRISGLTDDSWKIILSLEAALEKAKAITAPRSAAVFYRDAILSDCLKLRGCCDALEMLVSKKHWPFPTYSELLFSV